MLPENSNKSIHDIDKAYDRYDDNVEPLTDLGVPLELAKALYLKYHGDPNVDEIIELWESCKDLLVDGQVPLELFEELFECELIEKNFPESYTESANFLGSNSKLIAEMNKEYADFWTNPS